LSIEAKDIHDAIKALSDAVGPRNDATEIVKTLAWPLFALIALLSFRRPLAQFLRDLGSRVTKLSAFHVEVELGAAVTPSISLAGLTLSEGENVAGGSFTSSTMMELLRRIRETDPSYYLLVDIGYGRRWLISRVFLFSFILWRIGAIRCVVFVETSFRHTQRFLGTAEPERVCAALGEKYPWFKATIEEGWSRAAQAIPTNTMALPRYTAERLVGEFLYDSRIRRDAPPSYPPDRFNEWEEVPIDKERRFWEHSKWLNKKHLDEDLRPIFFDREESKLVDSSESPASQRNLGLLRRQLPFVALVNSAGEMKYLVDREAFLRRAGVHFSDNAWPSPPSSK
jgi:hypothetical protein